MKITKDLDIQEVGSVVCECLLREGVEAILTGGAVVSIYTDNEYASSDLDFITHADLKRIADALSKIGFLKSSTRHFTHPESQFFVEFPTPPLAIGNTPIKKWITQNNKHGRLLLLSPTHSVMDRLAGFFHWNDKQSLDQALMIARHQKINMKEVELWSEGEGHLAKFDEFLRLVNGGREGNK